MSDACAAPNKVVPSGKGTCLIDGVIKSSLVKQASDLRGGSVKVINCHDFVIYLLTSLRYATVYGCSDTTIVLGAGDKALRVEHCERVHVIAAAKRVCIANCRECVFFLGVNQQPLIVGDNHKLQLKNLEETRRSLREENRKNELSSALHVYLKDWLYASGNIRQLYCLQGN